MGRKKFTFKEVKRHFKDHNCKLLEKEYINCKIKMRYRCSCKNISEITFDNFRQGYRCKKCGIKRVAEKRKFSYKKVKKYFKDHDCELLEKEYKNTHTKMRYRCKCGNSKCKITFSKFKSGQRCRKCSGCEKYTFKEVKQYFKEQGCELLETKYIDNKAKMKYRCICGNDKCKISFGSFKRGSRCRKCSGKEKFTFKKVKQYFEDHDCELLETEYKNCMTKMRYICKCGNTKCKISFSSFKQGHRCKECGGKKYTFDFVYNYFEDHDCELFETEYKDANTLMRYRCDCGNKKCKISFSKFKNGHRCRECGNRKRGYSLEDVQKYFEDNNCKLLATEYKNNHTVMEYECECESGIIDKITFGNFKSGQRCHNCAIKKRSGKNNCNYNPNLTNEEREKGRYVPGLGKWKKDVYKQSNDTCQCCFKTKGKLIAHHIENYANNKELRTVVSNGFLFCKKHHIEFHKIYGYNCNREQLEEFLSTINLKVH